MTIYLSRQDQVLLLQNTANYMRAQEVKLDKVQWDDDLEGYAKDLSCGINSALHDSCANKFDAFDEGDKHAEAAAYREACMLSGHQLGVL